MPVPGAAWLQGAASARNWHPPPPPPAPTHLQQRGLGVQQRLAAVEQLAGHVPWQHGLQGVRPGAGGGVQSLGHLRAPLGRGRPLRQLQGLQVQGRGHGRAALSQSFEQQLALGCGLRHRLPLPSAACCCVNSPITPRQSRRNRLWTCPPAVPPMQN